MQIIDVEKISIPEDIFIIEMPTADFQKMLDKKDVEVYKTPKGNLYLIKSDRVIIGVA
jgi:hypothetical protein